MGRYISDGLSVDVEAPASTHIEKGEFYRIDGWNGVAFDDVTASEVDRSVALDVSLALWRVKVPSGKAGTRGGYLFWTAGSGYKAGAAALVDAPVAADDVACAKVEGVRNSDGYATIRVLNNGLTA